MFDFSQYEDKLKNEIGLKRYKHCFRVKDMALKINEKTNSKISEDKLVKASLLHDCAKYNEDYYLKKYKKFCDFPKEVVENKAVLHSFLGKIVAKEEYNISDEEVLDAIKYHTTGKKNMSNLEKIIFLADSCEIERSYPGVDEIRKLSYTNLDKAVLKSLDGNIRSLIDRKISIFPLTIDARNYLLKEKNG